MPAYDSSNWYALFFIFFLVINLYMFMNVLLAVIFNSYKKHLKVTTWTSQPNEPLNHPIVSVSQPS